MKKTLKKLFRAEASRKLFIKLFRLYIKLLLKTISIEIKADQDFESFSKQVNDRGGPFLFLSHGILLVGCLCWFFLYSKKKFKHHGYSLISNSFDGEIISESIEPFGLKTVFGSSRKRQRDSFQEIIEIYSKIH